MSAKVALVTGASRGIGRVIAERLARDGYRVVNFSRTKPGGDFPGESIAVDLSDPKATQAALDALLARGPVDALINNAGLIKVAPIADLRLDDFDMQVAVNLRAVAQITRAVVPGMRAKRSGRIVTIGSRAALGKEGRSAYGATKAAVIGLTRTWALELGRSGITVNVVSPGPIETEMFRANNPPGSPTAQALIAQIPVGRIGTPADVAAAVAFFLRDEASFITGQVLQVCGGLSIGSAAIP